MAAQATKATVSSSTAVTEQVGNESESSHDNNAGTYFGSGLSTQTVGDGIVTWTLDAARTVTHIKWWFASVSQESDWWLEYSTDNINWVRFGEVLEADLVLNWNLFEGPHVSAQYFRAIDQEDFYGNRIYEIEFYYDEGAFTRSYPRAAVADNEARFVKEGYNGLFNALGTNWGAEAWTNPDTVRSLVTTSNVPTYSTAYPYLAIDQTVAISIAANVLGSYWQADFGATTGVTLNHVTILARGGLYNLRNFVIEGSVNGTDFTDLYVAVDEGPPDNDWWVAPIDSSVEWRYIRIRNSGADEDGLNFTLIGEVEFYGFYGAAPVTAADTASVFELGKILITG